MDAVPTETQLGVKSTTAHADRLPTVAECTTHLRLLDAFVHLKEAVDGHGRAKGLVGDEAWDRFCRTAAARFLEWSQTVDAGDDAGAIALPTPPLDVLLVWHAFMLNPSAYRRYADEVLQGRLGGKGIDWEDLKAKLDHPNNHEGVDAHLATLRADDDDATTATTTPDGFDMVAAVQRQLRFSRAMHDARWLGLDPPALLPALLTAAVARYGRFLTLALAAAARARVPGGGGGLAPPPDVDLAWHTHLLSPRRYAAWCRGRLLDHRDDLPAADLARSAADAARLWGERFPGEAYRVCLCRRCVGARFGGGGDSDGASSSSSCAGGRRPADNCQTNCNAPQCQTNCNAPQCQTQCGTKCGYVCGACDAK